MPYAPSWSVVALRKRILAGDPFIVDMLHKGEDMEQGEPLGLAESPIGIVQFHLLYHRPFPPLDLGPYESAQPIGLRRLARGFNQFSMFPDDLDDQKHRDRNLLVFPILNREPLAFGFGVKSFL